MAFKPDTWFPIAVALSIANLLGVPFYLGQPAHAAAQLALAAGFGIWALRLRPTARAATRLETHEAVDALYSEVNELRRELNELQERLDFTERLLAQQGEARRVDRQSS